MILVVGNHCHDVVTCEQAKDGVPRRALGGSAAYIAAVLNALEAPFRVVAKVGRDFAHFGEVPAGAIVVDGARTTTFQMEYRQGERLQRLTAVCDPIRAADLGEPEAEIALACGVAFEILPETLRALRRRARVVVADIQGLIRGRDAEGRVFHKLLTETPFAGLLDQIDYLKVSRTEAAFVDLEAARRHTNLIVTDGARGCVLYSKVGAETRAPATAASGEIVEIDPTGAGDCFVAGFAYSLSRGRSVAHALETANYCGALAVTQFGVPKLTRESFAGVAARDLFR